MLAAQVNARKYDSLNTIFGIGWNGAPIVCVAHLECGWIALVGAVGGMGVILTDELPPMMRACSCCATPLALCSDRSSDGCSPHCFRVWCFWWASVLVVRVCRGRFHYVTLRLWSM